MLPNDSKMSAQAHTSALPAWGGSSVSASTGDWSNPAAFATGGSSLWGGIGGGLPLGGSPAIFSTGGWEESIAGSGSIVGGGLWGSDPIFSGRAEGVAGLIGGSSFW